ncbi:hypothetical protein EDB89DRAFT_2128628 [Lactarius sanguifluus]|nr:hypothetical protein EDB89DRAFT_2128628 [Lactarius sanguifluus]
MYIISIEYPSGWWSAGSCATWRDVVGYWRVSGRGGRWRGGRWRLGLACHVEVAWRGLARRVEVTWRGLGVCWVGVAAAWRGLACRVEVTWWGLGVCWVRVAVSQWVVGSCVPCRDGVGAGGGWALRATLRRRGGSAGSWRAMLGQRGLARRVGAARWVGSGGVSGQDGGVSHARMACNVQGFACRVGVAGWWWRHVASHVRGGVLGQGRMEAARVHEGTAMACNVEVMGEGLEKGGSGEAGRGEEVGAQAGVRWRDVVSSGGLICGVGMPLPSPRAHEPLPFVPAPTHCPDMARNTPPPPTRRPNMACKTFDPIYKISHSCTRATSILPRHPATANPPRHPNTNANPLHPAPPPPTHLADPTWHAKTPPTRYAASTWHTRPSCHRPPHHPDTARKTLPPTDSPPPRPNTRQDPATSPQHDAQDPATPPQCGTQGLVATDPHATPDMACNMPTHRHPDPTHAKTPPHRARPRRPAMPPQHDAQDPATPPQHSMQGPSRHRPPHHPNMARNIPPHTKSPPHQDAATADPPCHPNVARNTLPTHHNPDPIHTICTSTSLPVRQRTPGTVTPLSKQNGHNPCSSNCSTISSIWVKISSKIQSRTI